MIDAPIVALAQALGAALEERGLRIVTAESCTGGLVAGAIGISALGYVTDVTAKTRSETVPMTVLAIAGALAWLPWLVTGALFVAWQYAGMILSARIESSLVQGREDP